MPITVQKGGRPSAIVSIKAALAQLPLDTELAPILKRLGEGEEVTVQTRDGDEAVMTLLSAKPKEPEKLPASDRAYSARCTLYVPLNATVRVRASDEQFARERIIDALKGNASPPRRDFHVTINFDEFEQLFAHVDQYGHVPAGMIRQVNLESIEEVKLLGHAGS